MFDASKLFGQLLSGGMKSKRRHSKSSSSMLGGLGGSLGSGMKGAAAMGVLGVGIAAFEHFMKSRESGASAPMPGPMPSSSPPPAPRMSPPSATPKPDNEAVLRLIRSMISAAHADGVMDATERKGVFDRLNDAGLSSDEQLFLMREMDAPWSVAQLTNGVTDAAYASQLYAAALMAIEADTELEQAHLQSLASALRLSAADVDALHSQFA